MIDRVSQEKERGGENFETVNRPRSVLSMILKFETLLRKSEYRGA